MSIFTLEFEKTLKDLEEKISNLNKDSVSSINFDDNVASLKFQIENEGLRRSSSTHFCINLK